MVDVGRKRVLFSVRANKPRVMMSNTKLFTTAAALEAFGGKGTTVESLVGALKTAGLPGYAGASSETGRSSTQSSGRRGGS